MEAYQTIQLKTGTIIQDRYRIEQVLGSGGSAITYRATQLDTRRNVTVKQFVQYEERFEQEVAILRQFSYLEGVVSIVDAFHENTIFYIVMQYVEGITLAQYIKDNGAMHAEDVIPLFLPIMKSLGLLHKQGMIHRDISPDNFIIDFQNHLWLIDFGQPGISSNRRQQMKETASDQTVIEKAGYTPLEHIARMERSEVIPMYMRYAPRCIQHLPVIHCQMLSQGYKRTYYADYNHTGMAMESLK